MPRIVRHWAAIAPLCASIGISAPASAQKLFEGTITYEVTTPGTQTEVVLSARGKKLRQERHHADEPEAARGNFIVVDYDRGEVTTVFPAMKGYVVFDFKRIRDMVGARPRGGDDDDRALLGDIVATGRQEYIAGRSCEVYRFKNRPDEEWCLTTELGGLLGLGDDANAGTSDPGGLPLPRNDATAALLRSFKNGALILRMRTADRSGLLVTTIASKIDLKLPPERRFAIPGGYVELENVILGRP